MSVNSDRGLHDIYGHGKRLQKADFYNAFPAIKGVYNTHNAIDKTLHGRKRRVLSQAFSDAALKGMEDVMLLHVRQLCSKLSGYDEGESNEKKGVVRNMGNWFSYLSYDVMGELCFGKSFDMLIADGRRHMIGLVDRAANRHYVVCVLFISCFLLSFESDGLLVWTVDALGYMAPRPDLHPSPHAGPLELHHELSRGSK